MTRFRSIGLSLILAAMWAAAENALAQVPDGYEVVRLTNDSGIHSRAGINNRSEVVWSSAFPPTDSDVWLLSCGRRFRITGDGTYDVRPDINSVGDITWMRGQNWTPPFDVMLRTPSAIVQISGDREAEGGLAIDNAGAVVWTSDFSGDFTHAELFRYNGDGIAQLTANNLSNQVARTNSSGQIVWTRYDFSTSPSWSSTIMLYSDGLITELTDGTGQPWGSDINDAGQVVWGSHDAGIVLWEAGEVTSITNAGLWPAINSNSDIAFQRSNLETEDHVLDAWLYRDGRFYRLPDDGYWSFQLMINDRGEVAWPAFDEFIDTRMFLMRRIGPKGDFDHDCRVDLRDFGGFQACFTGADSGPEGGLLADCTRADFDGDGDVDLEDLRDFQESLTGPSQLVEGCEP